MRNNLYEKLGFARSTWALSAPAHSDIGLIESLPSYISRQKHYSDRILQRTYDDLVVRKLVGDSRTIRSVLSGSNVVPLSIAGYSALTENMCTVLRALNPNIEWEQMTLLPYTKPPFNKLHKFQLTKSIRWCSKCVLDWCETGQAIYLPLPWVTRGINACHLHREPLSNLCPHCGSFQKYLTPRFFDIRCSNCHEGLAVKGSSKYFSAQMELL